MARDRIPDSVKHPLSREADYAKPYLYGGTAFIVGILGLIVGLILLALGGIVSGLLFLGLGLILTLAGFLVARRGA